MNSSLMHERHFRRVLVPRFLVQEPSDVQICSEDQKMGNENVVPSGTISQGEQREV